MPMAMDLTGVLESTCSNETTKDMDIDDPLPAQSVEPIVVTAFPATSTACEHSPQVEINSCKNCDYYKEEIRSLKKTVNTLQTKAKRLQDRLDKKNSELEEISHKQNRKSLGIQTDSNDLEQHPPTEYPPTEYPPTESNVEEQEDGIADDPTWAPNPEDNDEENPNLRLDFEGKNQREEPKGIVFLSKLMLLFQYCHYCFSSNPKVAVSQNGTSLSIVSKCERCGETFNWTSQPILLNKFQAGNLLLSFAMLTAGASVRKMLLVFRHMNLLAYNE
ncbi:hypothetical protein QZH41_009154 [Actinostola sp. cb2023]|nr:hypothetical protein QZH41_009154 [Actinostola sp. cb2023]